MPGVESSGPLSGRNSVNVLVREQTVCCEIENSRINMMNTTTLVFTQQNHRLWIFVFLLMFGVFFVDWVTPLGMAVGALYVLPILATLGAQHLGMSRVVAVLAAAFVVLGYWVSPEGGDLGKVFLNRIISIVAVWVTYFIVAKDIRDGSAFLLEHETRILEKQQQTDLLHDKQQAMLNILEDYQKAQHALDAREEQSRLIEAAPSGMIMIDRQGIIVLANHLITQQFGYTQKELLGQPIEMLIPERFRLAHPAHRNSFFASPHTRRMGEGRDLFGLRKEGTEFPVEIGLNPINTPKGMFVLSSIVDVSERQRAEAEKDRLYKQLLDTSRRAGMADVAIGVLHNVGNVLNSVNVSVGMVQQILRRLSIDKISRTALMIHEHTEDLGTFLKDDPKGQLIPEYLTKLGEQLLSEQTQALSELEGLNKNIEHIKDIVRAQQNMAKSGGVLAPINPVEILEEAIVVNLASMMRHGVDIVRDFHDMSDIVADKHQVLQILINLISNAKYAIMEKAEPPSRMTLQVSQAKGYEGYVIWRVTDTGIGITPENMSRMFTQGFTTKETGHGFGLHSAALSAKMMGGSLTAHSDGEGKGATFTLELPVNPEEQGVCRDNRLASSI